MTKPQQTVIIDKFRSPLSTILMFLQNLLKRNSLDLDEKKILVLIMMQVHLLVSLINDQLDIKLIEDGEFRVKNEKFRVRQLFTFISSLFRPSTDLFGNQLIVAVDEQSVPHELFGDQVRMKQVLVNILSNAIKYTRGGRICLTVSYDSEDARLRCQIVDNGIGFNQEK